MVPRGAGRPAWKANFRLSAASTKELQPHLKESHSAESSARHCGEELTTTTFPSPHCAALLSTFRNFCQSSALPTRYSFWLSEITTTLQSTLGSVVHSSLPSLSPRVLGYV